MAPVIQNEEIPLAVHVVSVLVFRVHKISDPIYCVENAPFSRWNGPSIRLKSIGRSKHGYKSVDLPFNTKVIVFPVQ